jgi:tyrosyl-tRNA synthetase
MRQHIQVPEKRIAQHLLAREFVELVHSAEDAAVAQEKHKSRSGTAHGSAVPTTDLRLPADEVISQPYPFLIHAAGLAETRSRATKLVESGGAYLIDVTGHAIKVEKGATVAENDFISVSKDGREQRFLMIRAGKWKTRTIEVQ